MSKFELNNLIEKVAKPLWEDILKWCAENGITEDERNMSFEDFKTEIALNLDIYEPEQNNNTIINDDMLVFA